MKTLSLLLALILLPGVPSAAAAQPAPERLPRSSFDVTPPGDRVQGSLSRMRVVDRTCREAPLSSSELRRRIVDISVQEWAFFGFPVLDRLNGARLLPGAAFGAGQVTFENTTRRAPTPGPREGERVAATIAGYWAVTPEGPGIVAEQARRWSARGAGTRWNAPWSAAFISWVMCEAGLGTQDQFQRAIAHWSYVDQAILAREGEAPDAGYEAYEIGEEAVAPGDLLCTSRRPRYASLSERRRQMGEGASSHCDIVVEVDAAGERILAIGGNVLRAVSLKVLPAEVAPDGRVVARRTPSVPLYAHLKLRAEQLERWALRESAVLAALASDDGSSSSSPGSRVLAALRVEGPWSQERDGR